MTSRVLWAAAAALLATGAAAVPVNGTGDLTGEVIFGSGNADGSFTGETTGNVEVGLRGKVRYNGSGVAENTFNYDGGNTYVFDSTAGANPANRSVFNFEWSINVDVSETSGATVGDFNYALGFDTDPTNGVSYTFTDPINVGSADHSFGDTSTGNGAGVEATTNAEYANYLATYSVVQQSWNLGFFPLYPDPDAPGVYSFFLGVYAEGANPGIDEPLAFSEIVVRVEPIPVPPALPLLLGALGGLALLRRRARR